MGSLLLAVVVAVTVTAGVIPLLHDELTRCFLLPSSWEEVHLWTHSQIQLPETRYFRFLLLTTTCSARVLLPSQAISII